MISPADRVRAALAAFAVSVQPRPALSLIRDRTCKTAAPADTGAAAEAVIYRKDTAMTTIIQRRAREVRAGDIIVRDPDHRDLPVRWRVGRRPTLTGDGVVIIDYTDITDEPRAGIAHFDALTVLAVEPFGGAR